VLLFFSLIAHFVGSYSNKAHNFSAKGLLFSSLGIRHKIGLFCIWIYEPFSAMGLFIYQVCH
jgi:hypothetical protein